MKLSFCISLLLMCAVYATAQSSITWQHNYGGTNDDAASAIAISPAGDYYFAGYSYSDDTDVTGHHGSLESSDVWIIKTDVNGDLLWQNSFGGTKKDIAVSIAATADSGCIFIGESYSDNDDITSHHGTVTTKDLWVVKLDAAGNIMWERSLGGTSLEFAGNILLTDDGYILCGSTSSVDGDITFLHGLSTDVWIVQLDTDGNIIWQKCYGGIYSELANKMMRTASGNYIISGTSTSNDDDVSFNHGHNDVWIFEINADGDLLWEKSYGGSDDDWGIDLVQKDDNYFFVADVLSAGGDISDNHGEHDFWVVKIDATGNIIWQECLGGTDYDIPTGICFYNDNILVTGRTLSNDYNVVRSSESNAFDFWLVELDTDGDINWQRCLGGTNSDYGYAVQNADDNTLLLAGYAASSDGDITDHIGHDDMCVFKLDSCFSDAPVVISAAGTFNLCEGASLELSIEASGDITGYRWTQDGAGLYISDSTVLTLTDMDATNTGIYICNVFYACGYVSSESFNVTVYSPPVADITPLGDLNICETGSVELSAVYATGNTYQWYRDMAEIVGAIMPNYTALAPGNYSVVIISLIGCTNTSALTSVIDSCGDAMNIPENKNIDMCLYPNPVAENFTINLMMSASSEINYAIYTMQGDLVMHRELITDNKDGLQITVNTLNSGIYLLKVTTHSGEIWQKFIKQ